MKKIFKILGIILIVLLGVSFMSIYLEKKFSKEAYRYEEYSLVRNNVRLHLDKMEKIGKPTNKNILLIHGLTYSSHEFDIDYKDYSLVRALARDGYSVWRLDIAGYGRSEMIKDGFKTNSDYAVEDINVAVDKIIDLTGQERIDMLGWSWGTVTASKFAIKHPEKLNKLVLFAPIVGGIGECDLSKPFHQNTWEHAVDDFQRDEKGEIDYTKTDSMVVELWASSCWHYDRDKSPNGGRRDICVDKAKEVINVSALKTPTLLIYGDKDSYMNYELLEKAGTMLKEGSSIEIIKGGSHVVFIEKPYYKKFQKLVINYLSK